MLERLRALARALTERPGLMLLSAVIAAAVWLWVQGQEVRRVRVRVDLDLRTPDGLVNAAAAVSTVSVLVEGPLAAIRGAQTERPTVVLDLSRERAGSHDVPLEGLPLEGLPAGLVARSFSPDVVTVRLEPRIKRAFKVVAQVTGALEDGYEVGEVVVDPATVQVAGGRSALDRLASVSTRPITIDGFTTDTTAPVELELPEGVELVEPWTGMVTVPVIALRSTLTVSNVPVVVRGTTAWAPDEGSQVVAVTLEGPSTVLRGLGLDRVLAVVDLPAELEGTRVTARFRAASAPRLDVLVPREDVVRVVTPPPAVTLVRR